MSLINKIPAEFYTNVLPQLISFNKKNRIAFVFYSFLFGTVERDFVISLYEVVGGGGWYSGISYRNCKLIYLLTGLCELKRMNYNVRESLFYTIYLSETE